MSEARSLNPPAIFAALGRCVESRLEGCDLRPVCIENVAKVGTLRVQIVLCLQELALCGLCSLGFGGGLVEGVSEFCVAFEDLFLQVGLESLF